MASEDETPGTPCATACYRAAAEKIGRQFHSYDRFVTDAIYWLSGKWKDLHIEFHEHAGWQVSTCYADEKWGDDSWVSGDGSLPSALLKAVEVTSR